MTVLFFRSLFFVFCLPHPLDWIWRIQSLVPFLLLFGFDTRRFGTDVKEESVVEQAVRRCTCSTQAMMRKGVKCGDMKH